MSQLVRKILKWYKIAQRAINGNQRSINLLIEMKWTVVFRKIHHEDQNWLKSNLRGVTIYIRTLRSCVQYRKVGYATISLFQALGNLRNRDGRHKTRQKNTTRRSFLPSFDTRNSENVEQVKDYLFSISFGNSLLQTIPKRITGKPSLKWREICPYLQTCAKITERRHLTLKILRQNLR